MTLFPYVFLQLAWLIPTWCMTGWKRLRCLVSSTLWLHWTTWTLLSPPSVWPCSMSSLRRTCDLHSSGAIFIIHRVTSRFTCKEIYMENFCFRHFDRGINDWLCKWVCGSKFMGLNDRSRSIRGFDIKRELKHCRYVYDYIGGNHDKIFKELLATVCTFAVTTLWLGPCQLVYLWSFFNCFGLNFELWVAKFFSLPPFSTIEVRKMKDTRVGNK